MGEGILHQELGDVVLVPAFTLATDVNLNKSSDHLASQFSYLQGKGSNTDRRGTHWLQSTWKLRTKMRNLGMVLKKKKKCVEGIEKFEGGEETMKVYVVGIHK